MKFTDTQITLASNTKIPAETASADKGYTTPSDLASLTETLTNKTLTSPIINLGSDATGDVYYRNSTGQFTRLGVGSNGQVLTLASGLPSWATPGSGGLIYISEGLSSASPNATINAASLTVTGGSTNADFCLIPKGTGGIIAAVPNNLVSGGSKRGVYAVDLQTDRAQNTQVASGPNAVIGGGKNNTASGANAPTVGGGSGNTASGGLATVGGGNGNSATGGWTTVGGGSNNTASGNNSTVAGGSSNNVSNGGFASGSSNIASGISAIALGGSNVASGDYSYASGLWAITRGIHGCNAFASGRFSLTGDCQSCEYILNRQTTNATPIELSANNSTASASNQIILPNNHAYSFEGKVIARDTAGLYKIWHFTGGISRGANAAATVIGDYTIDPVHASAGTDAWSADFSANTTLGCLTVTVTGEAGKTIRWASHIETIELG